MKSTANPVVRWLAKAACWLFYRVDRVGQAPPAGAVLLLPNHPNALLDPAVVSRLGALELKARAIVEGFLLGLHRSPFRGFSVEFAEYRQYMPGDDPAFVDWKVYARSDRHYVKRFEQETNLPCHLVLDTSASMAYGSGSVTKLEYGQYLAAALAS